MKILLGISGSIAAYKSAELTSALIKKGDEINCLMTKNAHHFITPLTLSTLSRNPVLISLKEETENWKPNHIQVAEEADIFVIAPASADIIGKLANGIADDTLTSTFLMTRCPILIAPAMNGKMWTHPAVQKNIKSLKEQNCLFLNPEKGNLACGYEGIGKMISVEKILQEIDKHR